VCRQNPEEVARNTREGCIIVRITTLKYRAELGDRDNLQDSRWKEAKLVRDLEADKLLHIQFWGRPTRCLMHTILVVSYFGGVSRDPLYSVVSICYSAGKSDLILKILEVSRRYFHGFGFVYKRQTISRVNRSRLEHLKHTH
jgi:hypothetical protein